MLTKLAATVLCLSAALVNGTSREDVLDPPARAQSDLEPRCLIAVSYWPIDTPSPTNPWVQGQPMSIVWATGDGTGE